MQPKSMTMHPSCPTTSFCDPRLSVLSDTFQVVENLQGFEGLSALEESIVRLHEVLKSLLAGRFTEDRTLTLIAKMTTKNID
jgi:hypothetical protein